MLLTASPVFAEPTDIDTSVEAVIGAVKSAAELVKSGISTVDAGVQILKQAGHGDQTDQCIHTSTHMQC